jgi:GNAT superfamily N-acetyltransferase
VIRRCSAQELEDIFSVINDAAQAYRGVIPADRWHEPYMSLAELRRETDAGVAFWGYYEDGGLLGVMGLQPVADVALIRHAYTRTGAQGRGIGSELMEKIKEEARHPLLVGTWKAAVWAIRFYERRGFRLVSEQEKAVLLRRYWRIPERQVEESVVLTS